MAHKDYAAWHLFKSRINSLSKRPRFSEREVWWVAVGHNVGDEEDGKGQKFARPVLVVKKFNEALFYGLPLSSIIKPGKYYHRLIIRGRSNVVLLSHMRDYDAKRLLNRVAKINKTEYARVQLALFTLLKESLLKF